MTPAEAERLAAGRLSAPLLAHSRDTAAVAAALARRWDADETEATLAGLLHDLYREVPGGELLAAATRHQLAVGPLEERYPAQLLHGPVAAAELAAQGLARGCRLAIARHTLGGAGMSTLEKCVYLADYVEPGREFPGVDEARSLAYESLDGAVLLSVMGTLGYLMRRRRPIHGDTLALYNDLCR